LKKEEKKITYKSFVGPEELYDVIGLVQFSLLAYNGLKTKDKVLDIGCGSLRLGKYLISFLNKGNYFGIEPNDWLVKAALKFEISKTIKDKKAATFSNTDDFNLKIFDQKFDHLIANSIFIHACMDQIKECFKNAHEVMEDKGTFFFNFIEGEDNEKDFWSYPSAVTYKKETLKKLANKAGFIWKDIVWYYPGRQIWVKLTKKRKLDVSTGRKIEK
jgi:cyclopropane fatty-acyl-phospholipid synthase-like methyltransferase